MKRRLFLKGLAAFLAAPAAVFGTKKVAKAELARSVPPSFPPPRVIVGTTTLDVKEFVAEAEDGLYDNLIRQITESEDRRIITSFNASREMSIRCDRMVLYTDNLREVFGRPVWPINYLPVTVHFPKPT